MKRRKENYNIIRLFVCCGPLMRSVCSSKKKERDRNVQFVVRLKRTADHRNGNLQNRSVLI